MRCNVSEIPKVIKKGCKCFEIQVRKQIKYKTNSQKNKIKFAIPNVDVIRPSLCLRSEQNNLRSCTNFLPHKIYVCNEYVKPKAHRE